MHAERIALASVVMIVLIAAGMVAIGTEARGETLYGVGPGAPIGPFVADASTNDTVIVGTIDNPIPILIDPTGKPWDKIFTINRDGKGWAPGQSVTVTETIQFVPSTGTTVLPADWHEYIDPSYGDGGNFAWGSGSITVIAPTSGIYPAIIGSDPTSISFDFPPLPIPSEIQITKTLVWTDGVITPGPNGSNNYTIHVTERPSPEPSTLTLAGIAVAALLVYRRRGLSRH